MWQNQDEKSRYEIVRDETVGYYLYRYNSDGKCTHDYLQDTLDAAIHFATEKFGLDREEWREKLAKQ